MKDRLSWSMIFLILPTILFARSLDQERRLPHSSPSEWKALWYSNLEELQRANEANENNTVTNVTVQLGGTAFLHCKVHNLADRNGGDTEISWIRRRDWHVLTSSTFTYTSDERFQVLHLAGSDDWTLQLKYAQERDNGTYECQVSRSTGILSHYVNLNVVTPEAFILGGEEHHVDVGSIINLVCIIEKGDYEYKDAGIFKYYEIIPKGQGYYYQSFNVLESSDRTISITRVLSQWGESPSPPQYVFWYHNNRMINYDTPRGSVSVQTEPGPTQSRLTIHNALESDTGNYTCSASNTKPASIFVFVTEGDKMAAISRRKSTASSQQSSYVQTLTLLLLVIGFHIR